MGKEASKAAWPPAVEGATPGPASGLYVRSPWTGGVRGRFGQALWGSWEVQTRVGQARPETQGDGVVLGWRQESGQAEESILPCCAQGSMLVGGWGGAQGFAPPFQAGS